MEYFKPVASLSGEEREKAMQLFASPSKTPLETRAKQITKNAERQKTILKFIGLLSVAGPQRQVLLNPSLHITQMARTEDWDRIPYKNMIQSELRRIKGAKACVAGLHVDSSNNLLRVIMLRGKLGGDSEFGSNFIASVVHVFAKPPEAVVYNLAFKQMPMSTNANREEFRRKAVMAELKITQECSRLVEDGVCPNLPLLYGSWECNSCTYWNPKLNKPGVPRSCLMMANELSTGGDLRTWMLTRHSQEAWNSCIFQILAGLVAYHNILGYMHDDLHHGNVLYDVINPGGHWHYRFMTGRRAHTDLWIPNTGQQWKLWDFGLSRKMREPRSLRARQEMACDAMRILGIVAEPEGREKGMPDRTAQKTILSMVNTYEESGICDPDARVNRDLLRVFNYTPAFEIMLQLGWFRSRPPGKILNSEPYIMNVY